MAGDLTHPGGFNRKKVTLVPMTKILIQQAWEWAQEHEFFNKLPKLPNDLRLEYHCPVTEPFEEWRARKREFHPFINEVNPRHWLGLVQNLLKALHPTSCTSFHSQSLQDV